MLWCFVGPVFLELRTRELLASLTHAAAQSSRIQTLELESNGE